MTSLPSPASDEYLADMNDLLDALGQDKLITKHEQVFDEVVWNGTIITDTSTYSEFTGKGDFMEMNMAGHVYLALFLFSIFCLCYLTIFLRRQLFQGKLVEKRTTGDQDVKSEMFMLMLLTITTLLFLVTRNCGSQLEGGILNSNHKFKGNHLTKTIFAVVVHLPYKVSGEFSPYENQKDAKEYYDEQNEKNGKTDMKLRILVPTINTFHEFVKVDRSPEGNGVTVTGYSVDVFKEVMHSLPYRVSYEFFPYEGIHSLDMGYYDELIRQVRLKRYDGVVADITITSTRSKSGDFTLPYMMSGLSMIVPNVESHRHSHAFGLWWFLEPFTWGLWLLIIALFLSGGLSVWIFEHENSLQFNGTLREQLGIILSFCFSIFVFEQWEMPRSKSSRMVVIVGILVILVLGVSYSAKLQARLSMDNDRPMVTSLEQLVMNGDYVGYQKGSSVFGFLKHMGFQEEKLRGYSSEEYATALSRGSHNNGVSAIVDEIPYIKVFLVKYADRYTMAELPFSSGGFAFLFQRGCTIVPDVSRGILEFYEGEKRREFEKKLFGLQDPNPSPPISQESFRRLSAYDFGGLLLIIGPILGVAVLIFIVEHWKTPRNPSSNREEETSNTEESLTTQMSGSHRNGGSPDGGGGTDQVTPLENDLEAGVPSDGSCHSNIPSQNTSNSIEMGTLSSSPGEKSLS